MTRLTTLSTLLVLVVASGVQSRTPPAPSPTNLGSDANGNPLRRALETGHVSNYDEAKVPRYTLPDPLVMTNGRPVRNPREWKARRAEIVKHFRETSRVMAEGSCGQRRARRLTAPEDHSAVMAACTHGALLRVNLNCRAYR